uniref:RING-type domain-containing protein n=1 Tax=Chromera velia CCMP2878 TaxID=1169474 RepID=A0A0G4EZV7_9ALVE|eukprot:Cvel_14376.t1-p1 / transcript=Cvel_14376.t1 / gene=Cvel_14376 / organism=Chromera_velia_CCMP2878 / gene_product=RING finger protein 151, putative / transcript_product=RING finger protein 151, putative / location=Cvel_scaffold1020:29058-29645(-) / protein_length=196 / sequence_SO=supercontig / SO=protein_coding / is_pseudo=false
MSTEPKRLGLDASLAAPGWETQAANALCPICHDYIDDPKETDCATRHVFCDACIKEVYDNRRPCPCCRGQLSKLEKPQGLVLSFIEEVKWKCLNFEGGCDFTGTKKQLEKHLDSDCLEQKTKCPFEGCNKHMKRRLLAEHKKTCEYRLVPCDHCKESVRFNSKSMHLNTCPKFPVSYPNGCGKKTPQRRRLRSRQN